MLRRKVAQFFPGHSIQDAQGQPITDGIIAIKRRDVLHLVAIIEAKAGPDAAKELAWERTPRSEEDLRYAVDLLKERRSDLRGVRAAHLIKRFRRTLEKIMDRELPRRESGQARKDIERAAPGYGRGSTTVMVSGKPMKLRGGSASTLIIAVVPKDVTPSSLTPKAIRDQHAILKFERVNIHLDTSQLQGLATRLLRARR